MDYKVQRMSLESQGAYMKILCFMWADSEDQSSIQDNDTNLARSLGISRHKWNSIRRDFFQNGSELFSTDEKDHVRRLVSIRLRAEAEKQRNYRESLSKRGTMGGRPKKLQESYSLNSEKLQESSSVLSLQSSSSKAEKKEKVSTNVDTKKKDSQGSDDPLYATLDWITYRWNEIDGVKSIDEEMPLQTRKKIEARIGEQKKKSWWDEKFFPRVAQSDCLCGKSIEWRATLDWAMGPKNMTKILTDHYLNTMPSGFRGHDKRGPSGGSGAKSLLAKIASGEIPNE